MTLEMALNGVFSLPATKTFASMSRLDRNHVMDNTIILRVDKVFTE
jgi:hypothetical protein